MHPSFARNRPFFQRPNDFEHLVAKHATSRQEDAPPPPPRGPCLFPPCQVPPPKPGTDLFFVRTPWPWQPFRIGFVQWVQWSCQVKKFFVRAKLCGTDGESPRRRALERASDGGGCHSARTSEFSCSETTTVFLGAGSELMWPQSIVSSPYSFADAQKRVPPRGEHSGRVALPRDLVVGKRLGSHRMTQTALARPRRRPLTIPPVGVESRTRHGEEPVGGHSPLFHPFRTERRPMGFLSA